MGRATLTSYGLKVGNLILVLREYNAQLTMEPIPETPRLKTILKKHFL